MISFETFSKIAMYAFAILGANFFIFSIVGMDFLMLTVGVGLIGISTSMGCLHFMSTITERGDIN